MKLLFSFLLIFGLHQYCFSQKLIHQSVVESRQIEEISGFIDQGVFLVKASLPESVHQFQAIDANKGVLKSYRCTRNEATVLGYSSTPDSITIHFTSYYYESALESLTYSKSANRFSLTKVVDGNNQRKIIAALSNNGQFIFVSYLKKDKLFVMDTYQGPNLVSSHKLLIQDERVVKEMKEGMFQHVPAYNTISFEEAQSQRKAYVNNNKVVLISDEWHEEDTTGLQIVEIDVKTGILTHRALPLAYKKTSDHNSFLWQDQLFVVGLNRDFFNVSIYSLSDFHKVKEYQNPSGQAIALKASDLMRDRENMDAKWNATWEKNEKTRLTLVELSKGTPVISVATATDTSLRLLIGSTFTPSGGGGAMMMTSGGGSFNTPGGRVSMPSSTRWVPGTSGSSAEIKTSFYGYLNKEDLSVSQAPDIGHGAFSNIELRTEELVNTIRMSNKTIIHSMNNVYLLYINKKTKEILIEEF